MLLKMISFPGPSSACRFADREAEEDSEVVFWGNQITEKRKELLLPMTSILTEQSNLKFFELSIEPTS